MVSETDTTTIFSDTRGNSTILFDMGGNSTITLEDLDDAELKLLLPTIVYMVVLSVVGMLGNSVVCNVYRTRYQLSNSQCFILCLSVIDIFSCTVSIPLDVITVFSPYTFKHTWLCKISRFFNALGTLSAVFLLVTIAIERYRKVCRPFGWQFKANMVKFLCGLSVIFGMVFSWPQLVIYGKQKINIPKYSLTGTECSTGDSMLETIYSAIYSAVFGFLFLVWTILLCTIYCLIHRQTQKHAKKMPNSKQALTRKNTFVLFLVSIAFVLSYVPIVLLLIVRQLIYNFEEAMADEGRSVYNFFLRSYFFNSAINPVIYGFCDHRFRAACKETFSRCCCARESRDVDKHMTTLSLSQPQSH